jgi:CspA family cold shock protein
MTQGTVTWFEDDKGYGFVAGDDGVDVYVHYSQILSDGPRRLEPGQRVEFVVSHGDRGPQADQLRVLDA